jgi:NADH-quinone oxidoreductase subunit L
MATWLVIATIATPWLAALIINFLGDKNPRTQHAFASAFAVLGGIVSSGLLTITNSLPALRLPVGGIFGDFTLIADGLGVYLAVIAAIVGGLAVIFSNDYMKGEVQLGRYYSLTFLFIGAMAGLVLSGSLLFMFLFWEITAFCSYALISFNNDDPKAVAGGIKALIITQLGGIGLLAGAMISYANFGSYEVAAFLGGAQSLPAATLS